MICPEERIVGRIENLVDKFPIPGDLVVHLFSGTFAIAKECLELSWHRRFAGCDIKSGCFATSTDPLVEKYAGQVLNEKSGVSGSDEGVEA